MAKVLLHSVTLDEFYLARQPVSPDDLHQGKWMTGAHKLLVESAGLDPFGVHSLTDDPAEADLIIFADLGAEGLFAEWLRHHPWVKKYREKTFVFEVGDSTLPFLPGLYASLRKGYYGGGADADGVLSAAG